jgi:photosystem II stability/assembly factor-like uncharacterized protein
MAQSTFGKACSPWLLIALLFCCGCLPPPKAETPKLDLPADLLAELSVRDIPGAERVVALAGGGYFPTLLKLKDGSLGAVVRGGAPHVGVLSRLDWIRSWDGGRTWNFESTIVPATTEWDNRGSTAGQMADGTLVVGYWENTQYTGYVFDPDRPGGAIRAYYVYSTDGGLTWSKKRPLDARPQCTGVNLYGRIITLPDGTALMPAYGSNPTSKEHSVILRSRDHGRTWGDCSVIAEGFTEVSLARLPDGTLLAVMRGRQQSVWQTSSTDQGRTWSDPVHLTKSRQMPADICVLRSGHLLLTYGNRIGGLAVGAMLSRDGGKTWDKDRRVVLARGALVIPKNQGSDTGYPSTVQLDDGTIVTLYYRLGNSSLSPAQQERCLQYERQTFSPQAPASSEIRAFEQAIAIRYQEEQLK